MTTLMSDVRSTVIRMRDGYAGTAVGDAAANILERLDAPLRIAIAGRVKAGKSTLLNALVGEQLAPTDAGECTKIVTWYQHGPSYRATLELTTGTLVAARFSRATGAVEVDLGGRTAAEVRRIIIEWPSPRLVDLTLIDTPGIASANREVSGRATSFLTPEAERPSEADAVLYLMRHLHSADVAFLESFHDDELAHASPVNAIGVISRADEMGVGRPNAMRVAQRIAQRYRSEPQMRRLCQTVIPVGGLLAETAASLTEDEYRALHALAAAERHEVEQLLLSADRFVDGATTSGLTPIERRHLLDRLGVFGVRIALPLIRQGRTRSSRELAEALTTRSGIDQLRSELTGRFGRRSDVLRARSALLAVSAALSSATGDCAAALEADIDRIDASAHAFNEIRLLNAIRRGDIGFEEAETEEAERLLGGEGNALHAIVGLRDDATNDDIRIALIDTIAKWRQRQEHPLTGKDVAEAAAILVRSCEGFLAAMSQTPAALCG